MYILEPVVHETIWGGAKLKKYKNSECKIGHLYLVNGHKEMSNVVINGEFKGKSLHDIFLECRQQWNMNDFNEFPLTVALVDASANLSIQVHPDDEIAFELEGEKIGKTESWIFLEKPNNGWIYGGCVCEDKRQLCYYINNGKIAEVTDKFYVDDMDCVTVEAGTLHSMTEGSLVYEIEYGSDFTYRFFDFDRLDAFGNQRELHIDKAFKSIVIDKKPSKKKIVATQGINNRNYSIGYLESISNYSNESEEVEIFTVIKGRFICDGIEVVGGMSLLLLPGEQLDEINAEQVIIARLTR